MVEVIKYVDISVLECYRNEERQNKLYYDSKTKLKYPKSNHNIYPSGAIDIAPYHTKLPHIRWNNILEWYFYAGYITRVAHEKNYKIRWGGDWNHNYDFYDQTFYDLGHFELTKP